MAVSLSPTERRARIRDYKDAFPPMGIYAVRNTVTGRVWLGASTNVEGMLNRIRFQLKLGGHRDASLAADWKKHGPEAFSFEVLDRVKQRADPDFDYAAELQTMLQLWRAELAEVLA
jgi:hypothetical protein